MSTAPNRHQFFATCAPGIEPVLHGEAKRLKLGKVERQVGGVYFEGRIEDAWRANLYLRTAVRVLMRVARFRAESEEELYRHAKEVDWSRFLRPDGVLIVDAQSKESALDHTRFVEQRVKDAICDRFRESTGVRPSVGRDEADLGVHVHLFRDRCTLSVDTSGRALHRRGWRREQGAAPLAETLAAAVLELSGWDRRSPLVDPFCGSGTLLVEAGLMARGVAAGAFRESFGFEGWPGHDAKAWKKLKEAARKEELSRKGPILLGYDREPEALEAARKNAAGAGLEDRLQLERASAEDFAPRPGWNAWIVSNLPYGKRVGRGDDLASTYRRFGRVLRERCAGFHVALLCAKDKVRHELELGDVEEHPLTNGGLECVVIRTRIPEA